MPWITSFVNLQSNSVGTFSHDLSFVFFSFFFIHFFFFYVFIVENVCAQMFVAFFFRQIFSMIGFSADKSIFLPELFHKRCFPYIYYLNAMYNSISESFQTTTINTIEPFNWIICKFKRFFFRHGIPWTSGLVHTDDQDEEGIVQCDGTCFVFNRVKWTDLRTDRFNLWVRLCDKHSIENSIYMIFDMMTVFFVVVVYVTRTISCLLTTKIHFWLSLFLGFDKTSFTQLTSFFWSTFFCDFYLT